MDLSLVVEAHNAIKDQRTAKRHAWEAEDAELETKQLKLKALLLAQLNAAGATSIKTEKGTFYKSIRIKPSAADWSAIWEWMKANDALDLLEARLKSTFIRKYMEDHGGALPPGVNVIQEYEVSVRRPNVASAKTGEDDGD